MRSGREGVVWAVWGVGSAMTLVRTFLVSPSSESVRNRPWSAKSTISPSGRARVAAAGEDDGRDIPVAEERVEEERRKRMRPCWDLRHWAYRGWRMGKREEISSTSSSNEMGGSGVVRHAEAAGDTMMMEDGGGECGVEERVRERAEAMDEGLDVEGRTRVVVEGGEGGR